MQNSNSQEEEYEVEKIIGRGSVKDNGNVMYKVKWKGFNEDTWEPEENLAGCKHLIREFENAQKNFLPQNLIEQLQ